MNIMQNKTTPRIAVTILSSLLALCAFLYDVIGFESASDLWFEGLTLILLVYIYLTAYHFLKPYAFLTAGGALLLFNKAYDLLTEFPQIEYHADKFEIIDTLLDDGSLFIAFLLIAIGITHMMKRLAKQNMKDELTNLYNRRKLSEIELDAFDLIYFDLNDLKKVNDLKGHQVGDLMIIRFAQVLRNSCIKQEMALRVGGDEFVVITHKDRSMPFINSVCKQLENEQISFAYGIESTTREGLEEALINSDKRMYEMKAQQKKNRQQHFVQQQTTY